MIHDAIRAASQNAVVHPVRFTLAFPIRITPPASQRSRACVFHMMSNIPRTESLIVWIAAPGGLTQKNQWPRILPFVNKIKPPIGGFIILYFVLPCEPFQERNCYRIVLMPTEFLPAGLPWHPVLLLLHGSYRDVLRLLVLARL